MDDPRTVYIVHLVDTEGPLDETIEATFERLKANLGVSGLEPSAENLARIRNREMDLGGVEDEAAGMVDPDTLGYMRDWDMLDAMLDRVMSEEFRMALPDAQGKGWVYNWHCVDHVGYETNPRKRDMGRHRIFDHYAGRIAAQPGCPDALHWHFHPMPFCRAANQSGTSYLNSPQLFPLLSSRVIERGWFPVANRAGFHTERPDSHWFLEQWIPFDYSNQATDEPMPDSDRVDLIPGRFGDWRLAPSDWSVYHPHHDNYQLPGNCRRLVARCLNMSGAFSVLDRAEVDKAFARAASGLPTIMACTNHDFRDMAPEVDRVRSLVAEAASRHPGVRFVYAEAVEAMRRSGSTGDRRAAAPVDLDVRAELLPGGQGMLVVELRGGSVFGPQPYLALETTDGEFLTDNFDIREQGKKWFYVFDADTLPPSRVRNIGVAANDRFGNQSILRLEFSHA